MIKKGQHVIGSVQIKSDLPIQDLGQIISESILGGIKLGGIEKNIYEEVPAIFCGLLGFSAVLHGYAGLGDETSFWFDLVPNFSSQEDEKETIDLGNYLAALFKDRLKDHPEIKIK